MLFEAVDKRLPAGAVVLLLDLGVRVVRGGRSLDKEARDLRRLTVAEVELALEDCGQGLRGDLLFACFISLSQSLSL